MKGVAKVAETPGGSSSENPTEVAGEQLAPSQSEAEALNVRVNDVCLESSLKSDLRSPVPSSTIPRIDSLTIAFEHIQRKSAACVAVADAPDNNANRSLSSSDKAGEKNRPPQPRASSLKAANSRDPVEFKKALRFSDTMGLDLAQVHLVFDLDTPPQIPPQAMQDLVLPPDEEVGEEVKSEDAVKDLSADQHFELSQMTQQPDPQQQLYLSPSFAQPGSAPNFKSRITSQKVVLEKADYYASSSNCSSGLCGGSIRGLVRVANLGFEKQVRIRSTVDSWRSITEVVAEYQPDGNSSGIGDQFAFSLSLPDSLAIGDRVVLCVAYTVNSHTYWDNNFGDNYCFHCVAIDSSLGAAPELELAWSRYV